jgi:hypothetical protein
MGWHKLDVPEAADLADARFLPPRAQNDIPAGPLT